MTCSERTSPTTGRTHLIAISKHPRGVLTKAGLTRSHGAFGALLLAAGIGAATLGCGGDGNDGANPDGSGGNVGDSDIDLGNSSGGTQGANAAEFSESDGGLVELDSDQVSDLESLACTGWSAEGENLPATLQIVVDTSTSMTEAAPGSNDSKWEVTRDALDTAIADLPPSVAVGLLLYPNQPLNNLYGTGGDINSCVNTGGMVPISQLGNEGSEQRTTLSQSLEDATIEGFTPTHDAYRYALEEGLIPYQGLANKFMLLITDGAPTMRLVCDSSDPDGGGQNGGGFTLYDQPTQPIVDEIAAAYSSNNIRTFLIGSPGSDESSEETGADMRPWLSQAAIEGNTADANCQANGPDFCHMDMTEEPDFAAALSSGLSSIAGQIINSCTFAMPEPDGDQSIDATLTNLVVTWGDGTSALVKPDNVGDCSQGWRYNDDGHVELCADVCEQVKMDEDARVQLTFGCSVDEVEQVTK